MHGTGYRPDHDGHSVVWDYPRLVAPFAARLMAEYRRGWRSCHADYRITFAALGAEGPHWTVEEAATGEPVAVTGTRFTARILAWRHAVHGRAVQATSSSTGWPRHDSTPAPASACC